MSAKRTRRQNSPQSSTSAEPVSIKPSAATTHHASADSLLSDLSVTAPVSTVADDMPESSGAGCLTRLYWMMWGNFAVIVCALIVARQGGAWGIADLVYWLFVAFLPYVRRLDMQYGEGNDHLGRKSDMQSWRRYTVFIVAMGLVLWLVAHLAGPSLFRSK